jgi:hypothetical protein
VVCYYGVAGKQYRKGTPLVINTIRNLIGAEVQVQTRYSNTTVLMILGGYTTREIDGEVIIIVWGYSLNSGKRVEMGIVDICEI